MIDQLYQDFTTQLKFKHLTKVGYDDGVSIGIIYNGLEIYKVTCRDNSITWSPLSNQN